MTTMQSSDMGSRMVRILGCILSSLSAACASAVAFSDTPDEPDHEIACQATHELACAGPSCETTGGQALPVTVSVSTRSGAGELCTYTYCRPFVLVPAPGEDVSGAIARMTGYTLSESRGSTSSELGRPVIDYQLSISTGQDSFMLFGAGDGGVRGWAGQCKRSQAVLSDQGP